MRPEFLMERNGKQFALYVGLLDEAHQQGLKAIDTELVQIPTNENGNVAICRATVVTEKGSFTGLGDASPANVARPMLTCLIRMAETRAKARALRDAVNAAVACLDELDAEGHGDDTALPGGASQPPAPRQAAAPAAGGCPPAAARPAGPQPGAHITSDGEPLITASQRRMLEALQKQARDRTQLDGMTHARAAELITDLKARLSAGPRSA